MQNPPLAAELLIGAAGLFPGRPLKSSDGAAAEALPREWTREIGELMTSERPARRKRVSTDGYMRTWRQIVSKEDAGDGITDRNIADAYRAKIVLARSYLRDRWGMLTIERLTGPQTMEPGLSAKQAAMGVYSIISDPGRMVASLRSGCILEDELAAFKEVLPETYALVAALIQAELIKQRARRKGYQVPYHAEVAIRVYLGLPSGSPVSPVDKEPPKAPEPGPINTGEKPAKSTELRTKTDRVADIGPE